MGVNQIVNKAVFLDRDGVINKLVLNGQTGAYESPHAVSELVFYPWTFEALKRLLSAKYYLFVVSNQPSYAKGKVSLDTLKAIHTKLDDEMRKNGVIFKEYYYCYHHEKGIVSEFSITCECRKPKPFFVNKALSDYSVNREASWFVGDRDSDIQCGKAAGLGTILVKEPYSAQYHGAVSPDISADNLEKAVDIILAREHNEQT
jgi:D-glycero-D-manno-heptose 1,7-bisphosphate phosphatase